MITPTWKKVAVAVLAAGLLAGIFYFKAGSAKRDQTRFIDPAFAQYISSYTTGVIASGSYLTIGFQRDVVDSASVGNEAGKALFDFSPTIRGSTVWLDTRTVQFRPRDRMASGKVYTAKFHLSTIIKDLPDDLRTFAYSFQVIPQNFDVKIINTKAYHTTERQRQKIEGTIQTADYAALPKWKIQLRRGNQGKRCKCDGCMAKAEDNIILW